jgi:phosphoribosyl 1,2-cyclic phosphodiesterase
MWGYASESFGNQKPKASCTLTLGHMNPELEYDFTFFASRQDCQDLRETMFTLQGDKIYTDDVEAANNTSHSAYIKNVRPTTDGKIVINVAPGKKNYSKNRFYYLNAMTIKAHK